MNSIKYIYEDISTFLKNIDYNIIYGEITSAKISGKHQYITIKNGDIYLQCNAWFKSYDVAIGNNVKITGSIELSDRNMQLFFKIKSLEVIKSKDTETIKYEELKQKLIQKNMIYNVKKMIKIFPYNIGIITAKTGAVINDIKHVLVNKNFVGTIHVYNAFMQGEQCAKTVCDGIDYFNNLRVDLILIARGGGEKEHILCFSNELILNKIHESNIPIISAIGHEEDNPLSNDVADYFSSTPTNSAHLIMSLQTKYIEKINNIKNIIENYEMYFNETKKSFEKINFNEKIKYLNYIALRKKTDALKIKYSNIINEYEINKNNFMNQLYYLKPFVYKNNIEIVSKDDIHCNPKKLRLSFMDGSVDIYYKIV